MTKAWCAVFIGFVPITTGRSISSRAALNAFEPVLVHLMGYARSAEFAAEAERLGGYGLSSAGTVILDY